MLIACPFCKTEAQISEELEGSKVKCPQCKKAYTALEKAEKGEKALTPTKILLAALVVPAVGGFILYVAKRTSHDEPGTKTEQVGASSQVSAATTDARPSAPEKVWNTAALEAVRALFGAAYARDLERTAAAIAGADARERAKQLVRDEDEFAFAKWKPGELRILTQDDARSLVAVPLLSRETPGATCEYEFELAQDGGRWKVAQWKRTRGGEPEAAESAPAQGSGADARTIAARALKVNLEPRRLEHLESTSPELRTRIDGLYARMLDFSLSPSDNARASDELVEIGKPALPLLLTGILEQRITDMDSVSKAILINQSLQRITDHPTVFAPRPDLAEVEALRLKTVTSWFEWWGYSGERFQTKPKLPDPFDAELEPQKKR